jgi:NitT/TauT family transport system substrate-binding protein
VFSEPFIVRRQGGKPRVLMVSELGFDPYTSVLLTSPDLVRKQPELVRKVVRASVRGWLQYLQDPAKTNEAIREKNGEMDREVLAYGAEQVSALCIDEGAEGRPFGTMTLARWRTLCDQLVEVEAMKPASVDPVDVFTCDFLPDPVGSPEQ